MYENHSTKLTVTYESWEKHYYHNARCFSALLEIFQGIDFEVLVKLLNSILDKITLRNVFDENIHKSIKTRTYHSGYFDVIKHIRNLKSDDESNNLLLENPSEDVESSVSVEAIKLLELLANESTGQLLKVSDLSGLEITVGRICINEKEDHRDTALWESVIDELLSARLVKQVDGKGQVFEITNSGYIFLERIS